MSKKITLFLLFSFLILSSLFTIDNFKNLETEEVKAAGESWYSTGGT